MTRLRTFPAPTFHSMSLTRAAFFHARVGDTPALCERGAKPESRSDLGFTPLTTAVMDADHRVIALLLDHGANPDGGGPEGLTPLMLAAMLDCVELVDLLLEHGASLDLALADGSTALSVALAVEALRAAQLLLGRRPGRASLIMS
ncbi:MAG: ankyrin repeat domain-containing protein [Deltaproteobacteria bacterium]|nr:MAG: ankyrin repeat domain-containing protein [Deltaproteobacteria bacterium]